MGEPMNETNVRSFMRVVETGSLNRAAQRLFISKPALKKQLDALEAELGVKLLVRSTEGCLPTPAGRYFYERSADLLARLQETVRETRSIGNGRGTLRFGVLPSFTSPYLDEAFGLFARNHPEVEVQLIPVHYDGRVDAVLNGDVDVVVYLNIPFVEGHAGLTMWQLTPLEWKGDECVCILGPDDQLCGKERVDLADLQGRKLVMPDSRILGLIVEKARSEGVHVSGDIIEVNHYKILSACSRGEVYIGASYLRDEFKTLSFVSLNVELPETGLLSRARYAAEVPWLVDSMRETLSSVAGQG